MSPTPSERNLVMPPTVVLVHAAAVSQPDATARLILEVAAPLRAAA
jgi:hypothetical protein